MLEHLGFDDYLHMPKPHLIICSPTKIIKFTGKKRGSVLLEYNDKNTEYKYVDSLKGALARLYFIHTQE